MTERRCEVCGGPLKQGDVGAGRRRYCSPPCVREGKRRTGRAARGLNPEAIRRGPEGGLARLAERTRVRGNSRAWWMYAQLLADEQVEIAHAEALQLLTGGDEGQAWQSLLQLERLGLFERDRPGGVWRVLPPASPEARLWVADNLAGGSHQRGSSASG